MKSVTPKHKRCSNDGRRSLYSSSPFAVAAVEVAAKALPCRVCYGGSIGGCEGEIKVIVVSGGVGVDGAIMEEERICCLGSV